MANDGNKQRKFAAIIFTDKVGSTVLTQRDEAFACESILKGRQTIAQGFSPGSATRWQIAPEGRKNIELHPPVGHRAYDIDRDFCRPFGTRFIFRRDPGLAPWAIIYRPAGA